MKSMLLTGVVMMLIAAGQPATAQSQPTKRFRMRPPHGQRPWHPATPTRGESTHRMTSS